MRMFGMWHKNTSVFSLLVQRISLSHVLSLANLCSSCYIEWWRCHYHCTHSGKSLTYWMPLGMPLLFIKHGITVVVTPLKLLRGQFVEMLQDNSISAVSITASNTTNELFEMILLGWLSVILLTVSNNLIDLVLWWSTCCQRMGWHIFLCCMDCGWTVGCRVVNVGYYLSRWQMGFCATCQTCAYHHTKLHQSLWKIRNT